MTRLFSQSPLYKTFNLQFHKIALVQKFKPNDLNVCHVFGTNFNVLISDEAHFHLNGHVDERHNQYFGQENNKSKRVECSIF